MPDRNDESFAAPPSRTRVLGDELVRIHDGLRRELAALLAEVEDFLAGRADGGTRPPPDLGAQLSGRCLTVCGDIHTHHDTETSRGFPRLERRFPELAPALAQLRHEHDALAEQRRRLEETLADGDAGRVRAGLRRLAADLDAHFRREERLLVPSLNALL